MTVEPKKRLCKDCKIPSRNAKFPGPRCYSCHNVRKREMRLAAHSRRTTTKFGLPEGEYQRLYEFQGGLCAICRRGKGNPNGDRGKKNLAVDHDHSCCPGKTSCGKCVRGLVCGPCNDVLAHFRDDPECGARLAQYLTLWPRRYMESVPDGQWPIDGRGA